MSDPTSEERSRLVQTVFDALKTRGRIVIVGASLAGLRGAEALRKAEFKGPLTIIGDEPDEPYDRPPLSKQVLKGWVPATHTKLPRLRAVDADWRLGVAATRLDRANRVVHLANGDEIPFDRLLIATGVRSRPWPNPAEAALEGVYTLRTSTDAARLQSALAAMPRRVLVIGAGFIGSEVASVCRQLGLEVTVAERAAAPLAGALGGVVGAIAAEIQRAHGVDLRLGVSVLALEGDSAGHVRRVRLSDGTTLEVDVVLASLGSIRNIEWLEGAGLAAGYLGRRLRRWLPRLRHPRCRHRQHFRSGRHRAFSARSVRVRVSLDGTLGQRCPRSGDRRPQYGERRNQTPPASASARFLVGAVWGQHQVGRGSFIRRPDHLYAGLSQRASVRSRLWTSGSHRWRGHFRSREVAGLLQGTD